MEITEEEKKQAELESSSSILEADDEILVHIQGQPKILRIVLEHTFMNLAIPHFSTQIISGFSPKVEDYNEAVDLNDYLLKRFAISENKIAFSSDFCKQEVLTKIPQEQHSVKSITLLFRHIEFHKVSAEKPRESTIKVADKIASDRRYYIILVPASNVDIEKLKTTAERTLQTNLLFTISKPKDVLKLLRSRDPLKASVDNL